MLYDFDSVQKYELNGSARAALFAYVLGYEIRFVRIARWVSSAFYTAANCVKSDSIVCLANLRWGVITEDLGKLLKSYSLVMKYNFCL